MSKILLESDFLTVNLNTITNTQTARSNARVDASVENTNKNIPAKGAWEAWGNELKKRLSDNKTKPAAEQQSDFEVESEFFTDFYTANWQPTIAQQLELIGDPLKKALKVLSFNIDVNPILAFIAQQYVQDKLIGPKLLNVNTFRAIYNAVAKNLVADSEFFSYHSYNIIYCPDLYRRTDKEIENYLKVQSSSLKPSEKLYTAKAQLKNRKIFFHIDSIKELDNIKRKKEIENFADIKQIPVAKSAKLNSLKLIQEISDIDLSFDSKNKQRNKNMNTQEINALVQKLQTPAQCFAAIQYLSVDTDVAEAKKALSHNRFSRLSVDSITAATKQVAPIMSKIKLSSEGAKVLIALILNKLG